MNYLHFCTFLFVTVNTAIVGFWWVSERPFLRSKLEHIDSKIAEFDAAVLYLHNFIAPKIMDLERRFPS